MKKVIFVLMIALVLPFFGQEMELPSWVDAAIEEGNSAKKSPVCHIQKKMLGIKLKYGKLSTPYTRVAEAAFDAKKKFMTFTKKDITPEMLEPKAIAIIPPFIGKKVSDSHRSVEHIIILTKYKIKKPKPGEVIQPIKIEKLLASKSNVFGFKVEKEGIIAEFALEDLKEGRGFLIMYEKKFPEKSKFKIKITKKMLKKALGSK